MSYFLQTHWGRGGRSREKRERNIISEVFCRVNRQVRIQSSACTTTARAVLSGPGGGLQTAGLEWEVLQGHGGVHRDRVGEEAGVVLLHTEGLRLMKGGRRLRRVFERHRSSGSDGGCQAEVIIVIYNEWGGRQCNLMELLNNERLSVEMADVFYQSASYQFKFKIPIPMAGLHFLVEAICNRLSL